MNVLLRFDIMKGDLGELKNDTFVSDAERA